MVLGISPLGDEFVHFVRRDKVPAWRLGSGGVSNLSTRNVLFFSHFFIELCENFSFRVTHNDGRYLPRVAPCREPDTWEECQLGYTHGNSGITCLPVGVTLRTVFALEVKLKGRELLFSLAPCNIHLKCAVVQ